MSKTIVLLLLALPLTPCTSTATTLYSGEMELVTVSGSGCSEKDKGNRIRLELVLEQSKSADGQQITGYFNGPDIQSGRFFGNDLGQLLVVYPDESGPTPQGHTLVLSTTPEGVNGELHEKPRADSINCYFEKAVLRLKREETGSKAKLWYDSQNKLFSANVYYHSGQLLLNVDKPEEAIHEFTESLKLRNMVNPNDPERAYPEVSIAIAHVMAGREAHALTILRDLFGEKSVTGDAMTKQRSTASDSLCNSVLSLEGDAGQKAATHLMNVAAREFGSFNGVAIPLAKCYNELGMDRKEQDDPDLAIEYFQKALKLHPDDQNSIAGIVMSYVDKEAPAEGRKYLNEHAQSYIEKAGKESYDSILSYLYAVEAQQVENDGDLLRAEQLSRDALKVRPGERALLIRLTRVLGKAGKYAEARRLLEDGSKGCGDETCRQEYADELARQDLIERTVKRLHTVE